MKYKGLGIRLRNIINEGTMKSFPIKVEMKLMRKVVNPINNIEYDYKVDIGE